MPKINQEEYSFLKNLDNKWKWIARNRDGGLYKFQETPEKIDSFRWNDRKQTWLGIYGNLFQFIQWEDENPYSITELIEKYEEHEFYNYVGWEHYKKGEAEVKKNIEWAKNRIKNTLKFEALNDIEIGFKEALKETLEILDQLDEPEVKELKRKIKELESYNDELIRDNNQFRNALDNQEVLSPNWIDNNSVYASHDGVTEEYVHVDELKELFVPKQEEREQLEIAYKDILNRGEFWFDDKEYVVVEKPVIPQFVADFINVREDWAVFELFDDEWLYKEHDQIARWLYDNDDAVNRKREADLVFARKKGFTVEKEQKYYVMNNDNRMMLVRMMDGKTITEADPFKLEDMYEGEKKSHRLTEQEIKDYDERYWAFRKPVEELE